MPSQVWPRTQSRRKGHHYYKAHLVTIFYLIGPVWEAVPHKCLGVRGNWVRDRNRGVGDIKKVLLEGGRPGSVEGRKNGLGLESSPGLGFKS